MQGANGSEITAVISRSGTELRTQKVLMALILGLPLLKPSWVTACQAERQRLAMDDPEHVWLGPAACCTALRSKRVLIPREAQRQKLALLLELCGTKSLLD